MKARLLSQIPQNHPTHPTYADFWLAIYWWFIARILFHYSVVSGQGLKLGIKG